MRLSLEDDNIQAHLRIHKKGWETYASLPSDDVTKTRPNAIFDCGRRYMTFIVDPKALNKRHSHGSLLG